VCEYYHIVETDRLTISRWRRPAQRRGCQPELHSLRAAANGKQLDSNNSGYAITPDDLIPPTGWANFKPTAWQDSQTVPVQVQVQDTQSGLDVATAEYAVSTDGGATWGAWQAAVCTGSSGTQDPQMISADAAFGQDSGASNLNKVKFRIRDRTTISDQPCLRGQGGHVKPANRPAALAPHQPNVCPS